jgi:hypothetical protein
MVIWETYGYAKNIISFSLSNKKVVVKNLIAIATNPPSIDVALGLPPKLNGAGATPNVSCD